MLPRIRSRLLAIQPHSKVYTEGRARRYAPGSLYSTYNKSGNETPSAVSASASPSSAGDQHEVGFDDPAMVTRGKSIWEVMRGWLVFKMFTFDTLVDNSLRFYSISKRFLGSWLTERLLRLMVFGQFAGGLQEEDTKETVLTLAQRNITSIWFYSIERDLDEIGVPRDSADFYLQEDFFNEVNSRYLKSIEMSAAYNCNQPLRFAALKLTAIVNPHLLNKLNELLVNSEEVFLSLASPGKYTVDRSISLAQLSQVMPDVELVRERNHRELADLSFTEWTQYYSIATNLQRFQELKMLPRDLTSFSDLELEQYDGLLQRLSAIGECAQSNNVCILIDAEQTHFQKAIEHLTLHLLSKRCNSSSRKVPLIYNTLQTYLVKSYDSLLSYLAATKALGITGAIKVVRGCYMEQERRNASNLDVDSPVHASKALTDESYHCALEHLIKEVQKGAAHIMVASHNKDTVQKALQLMEHYELAPDDGTVAFGQLLGMGDHLTYPLASAGYIASKVVPYGLMDDMMPFLSRRGNENRGMIKNARAERLLYSQEFKRRFFNL